MKDFVLCPPYFLCGYFKEIPQMNRCSNILTILIFLNMIIPFKSQYCYTPSKQSILFRGYTTFRTIQSTLKLPNQVSACRNARRNGGTCAEKEIDLSIRHYTKVPNELFLCKHSLLPNYAWSTERIMSFLPLPFQCTLGR